MYLFILYVITVFISSIYGSYGLEIKMIALSLSVSLNKYCSNSNVFFSYVK